MLDVSYDITEHGLVFTADAETQQEIQELMKEESATYWSVVCDVFEHATCNGLSFVYPEDIGALTDSIIFADDSQDDDGQYGEETQFFWFPDYQVTDPIEVLATTGKVVFVKGE